MQHAYLDAGWLQLRKFLNFACMLVFVGTSLGGSYNACHAMSTHNAVITDRVNAMQKTKTLGDGVIQLN